MGPSRTTPLSAVYDISTYRHWVYFEADDELGLSPNFHVN